MPLHSLAKEEEKNKDGGLEIPDSVLDITKENTYPNPTQDLPYLQPSELTTSLLETTDVTIENPDLIKMLNESSMNDSKLAVGFRASIYLGEWPLSYSSSETNVNWEYKKINTNYLDNRGGQAPKKMSYNQEKQQKVTGGLTANIPNKDQVKKMMMIKAAENTGLPLAFETIIGQGTKKGQVYNVSPKNVGYLYGYVPAANEKGKVTYGEVYLTFKGSKAQLEVKNVTQQGIGAWIPVQDRLSFQFITANQPK
nr:YfkD family protein [Desertibacillus haloalkaliphilus]